MNPSACIAGDVVAAEQLDATSLLADNCCDWSAQFFVRRGNAALTERSVAEQESLAVLPLQQRLHTLLRWRLEMQQPYIGALGLLKIIRVLCVTLLKGTKFWCA